MDWRNKIGLYGSYFLGVAGIGFTLPYLPLYLSEENMSDRMIGLVSTLAALPSLIQYPIGLWSDRLGTRKPFLIVALALLALSTWLLRSAHGLVWVSFLVVLFAENGICRAILWLFVVAMVLFHVANAPGGVYLGLFLKRDLEAPPQTLSQAFVVSMLAWMLVVRVSGPLADRIGRRPLLIAGWSMAAARLALVSLATSPWQVLAIQVLDGSAQALFVVAAAAWVTDRLADPNRIGEAQVLVGTSLVFGSAIGPALSGLVVDQLGYRGLFALLAGVAAVATTVIVLKIPETKPGLAPATNREAASASPLITARRS